LTSLHFVDSEGAIDRLVCVRSNTFQFTANGEFGMNTVTATTNDLISATNGTSRFRVDANCVLITPTVLMGVWNVGLGTNSYSMPSNLTYVTVTSAAAVALALPAPSVGLSGWMPGVKDKGGNANTYNITITPASGTIDGAVSYTINANYGRVRFLCDGTNYFVIGQ
jgi:hypothetical protein